MKSPLNIEYPKHFHVSCNEEFYSYDYSKLIAEIAKSSILR